MDFKRKIYELQIWIFNMQFIIAFITFFGSMLHQMTCSMLYQDAVFSTRCMVHCGSQNINITNLRNGHVTNQCYDNCKSREDWKNDFIMGINTTNIDISQPNILCQEFTKTNVKVILSWNVVKPVDFMARGAIFIIEDMELLQQLQIWNVIGITRHTFIEISNLSIGHKYCFRITFVLSLKLISIPVYSSWIHILNDTNVISAPSNVHIISHITSDNKVDVSVSWTSSKEHPCSYDITWFPNRADEVVQQDTVTLPLKNNSVLLPDLLPGTSYALEISPYDPSGLHAVKSVKTHFLTKCRYYYGDVYFSDTCTDDHPQNLTATWHYNSSEIFITWLPPEAVMENALSAMYKVSIWIEASLPGNLLLAETLPANVSEVSIKIVKPVTKLIIEVYALVNGYIGQTAKLEFQHNQMSAIKLRVDNTYTSTWLIFVIALALIIGFMILILWVKQRYGVKPKSEDSFRWKQVRVPAQLKPYVIPSHKVFCREELGHGAFGVVYKGILENSSQETIAIKEFTLIDHVLKEAEVMESLGRHRHIVSFRGICIDSDPVYLLLEYCPLGDLLTWLKAKQGELNPDDSSYLNISKSEVDTNSQFDSSISSQTPILEPSEAHTSLKSFESRALLYIYQVALAMEHIASNKLVHRDIAARNVLLYSHNVVKLADFGLARDVYEEMTYVIKESWRLPIRWMALETLEKHVFTLHSDVWSFGVLMWEIMSFGAHPYPGLQNDHILSYLQQNHRMERPQHCSTEVYHIMKSCWLEEPKHRPTFRKLKHQFGEILDREKYTEIL